MEWDQPVSRSTKWEYYQPALDWLVDEAGYELVEVGPPRQGTAAAAAVHGTILAGQEAELQIVRKGGSLVIRDPFETRGLHRKFASLAVKPEGALKFVNEHGFLFEPEKRSFSLGRMTGYAENMVRLLRLQEAGDWNALARWTNEAAHSSTLHGAGSLGLVLKWSDEWPRRQNSEKLPKLLLRPANLIGALIFQFLQSVADGVGQRKCRNPTCNEWFVYGPGTAHRATAIYHSSKCRYQHRYLRKKEQGS